MVKLEKQLSDQRALFQELQSKSQAQEAQLRRLGGRPRDSEDLGDFETTLQSFLAAKNVEIEAHKKAQQSVTGERAEQLETQLLNEQNYNNKLKGDMIDFIRVNYNKLEKNRKKELYDRDFTIKELSARLAKQSSPRPADRVSPGRNSSNAGETSLTTESDLQKNNAYLKSMAKTLNKDK